MTDTLRSDFHIAAPEASPDDRAVLAFDIGGTKTAVALVGPTGSYDPLPTVPTPLTRTSAIEHLVLSTFLEAGGADRVRAIGLSVAGLVATDRSTVTLAPNLPLDQYDLGQRMGSLCGVPVVVENDVNACAWGEYLKTPAEVMLMVMIGTGLGGAVVTDGHLLRGAQGVAAEIGHLTVSTDGPPCGCGSRGCWEQYVSGSALVRAAGQRLRDGFPSSLTDRVDLTGVEIQAAADLGDALARWCFADLGLALGRGLGNLITLINPSVVVISGGVAASADHFLPQARATLSETTGPRLRFLEPELRVSTLGTEAALRGVADLAATQAATLPASNFG